MLEGQYYYLPFAVTADSCSSCKRDGGQFEEAWAYLGKVTAKNGESITFSMADAHKIARTDAQDETSEMIYKLDKDGTEYKVWTAVGYPAPSGGALGGGCLLPLKNHARPQLMR